MALTIHAIQKHNRQRMYGSLQLHYHLMLRLCLEDLKRADAHGRIQVIFQTGNSQIRDRAFGMAWQAQWANWQGAAYAKIYVYTYRRPLKSNLNTLAHEFGHIHYTATHQKGDGETYAVNYAQNMMGCYREFCRQVGIYV